LNSRTAVGDRTFKRLTVGPEPTTVGPESAADIDHRDAMAGSAAARFRTGDLALEAPVGARPPQSAALAAVGQRCSCGELAASIAV
jgi:hypothetical protein